MARTVNPYVADAGQYNAIGQGMNNLAQVFLQQNDPTDAAKVQAYAWGARKDRESVLDAQQARTGRSQLGDALRAFDPTGDNRGLAASGVGSGALDPSQMGDLFRVMQANFGGSDDQVLRSVVGAGGNVDKNNAFSMQGQADLAARDHQYAVAEDSANVSLQEALGNAFRSGQVGLEDIYKAQHPNRYADAANGGSTTDPWLQATRREDLEAAADEAISNMAADLGMDPGAVPADLRTLLLQGAMQAIQNGGGTPRAAVGDLWQQHNVQVDDPWFGGPSLQWQPPAQGAAQPRPNQAQGGTGGDANLANAKAAIAKGADAAAVRNRLLENGYTDSQLMEAGI